MNAPKIPHWIIFSSFSPKAIQSIDNRRSSRNCTDVWQLKIMQVIMKNQQENEGSLVDSSALLSLEILNSLSMRFKMVMEKRLLENKSELGRFLIEKNLNFLQSFDLASIKELMQLVVFYGFSSNFLETLDVGNINLVQFIFELKKKQKSLNSDFILSLWKLLKN